MNRIMSCLWKAPTPTIEECANLKKALKKQTHKANKHWLNLSLNEQHQHTRLMEETLAKLNMCNSSIGGSRKYQRKSYKSNSMIQHKNRTRHTRRKTHRKRRA